MQVNTIQQLPQSFIELKLPQTQGCPSAIRLNLDHLLLAIEAIDLQAPEAILELVEELALNNIIPNRVSLWRMRNTNPYRRNYQRGTMTWQEAKALVLIICYIARRINTHLRLLVITSYQVSENKIESLGLQNNLAYLNAYLNQFQELFLSRMRSPSILNEQQIQDLGIHLLTQLLFCSGSLGEQRLWNNLIGSKN